MGRGRRRKKARVYQLISAASFSWVSCFHFVGFRLSVEGDWFSLSSSQNPLRAETEKHGINFKTNPGGEIGHWPRHSSSREICRKKAFLIAPTTTKQRFRDQGFPSFKLWSPWSSIILIEPRFNLFLGRSDLNVDHIVFESFDGWTRLLERVFMQLYRLYWSDPSLSTNIIINTKLYTQILSRSRNQRILGGKRYRWVELVGKGERNQERRKRNGLKSKSGTKETRKDKEQR